MRFEKVFEVFGEPREDAFMMEQSAISEEYSVEEHLEIDVALVVLVVHTAQVELFGLPLHNEPLHFLTRYNTDASFASFSTPIGMFITLWH